MNPVEKRKISNTTLMPVPHVLLELKWLNLLIKARILDLRLTNFYDKLKTPFNLYIADDEIDAFFESGELLKENTNDNYEKNKNLLYQRANALRKEIDQRIYLARKQNNFLPLLHIKECFDLTEFELTTILICLAPQVDARYEKIYAYLQNDISKKLPSIDLVLNLVFPDSVEKRLSTRRYFSPRSALFKYKLIESIENDYEKTGSLLSTRIKVNNHMADFLFGSRIFCHEFQSLAELYFSDQELDSIILSENIKENISAFIKWFKENNQEKRPNIIFSFYGPYGAGKKETAGAMCRSLGLPLLIVNCEVLRH